MGIPVPITFVIQSSQHPNTTTHHPPHRPPLTVLHHLRHTAVHLSTTRSGRRRRQPVCPLPPADVFPRPPSSGLHPPASSVLRSPVTTPRPLSNLQSSGQVGKQASSHGGKQALALIGTGGTTGGYRNVHKPGHALHASEGETQQSGEEKASKAEFYQGNPADERTWVLHPLAPPSERCVRSTNLSRARTHTPSADATNQPSTPTNQINNQANTPLATYQPAKIARLHGAATAVVGRSSKRRTLRSCACASTRQKRELSQGSLSSKHLSLSISADHPAPPALL